MYDFDTVKDDELSRSLLHLRRILKDRGWKNARAVITDKTFVVATRPDGKEITICAGTPPTTSFAAATICDDKYATYCFLQEIPGVKQPDTVLLYSPEDEAKEYEVLTTFLREHPKITLKPFNGAHGRSVIVNISDVDTAESALGFIRSSGTKHVIAQEMLESKYPEARVICINEKYIAAFSRIPAAVTGDGNHSVRELIDIENQTIRTKPYRSNLAYINRESALKYLNSKNPTLADSIPELGQKVRVAAVCNTGQGGTMEDITDGFPKHLIEISENIAKKFNLPLVGVDFLGDYVIEINRSPALYHPVDGKASTRCIEAFVKYLESI